MITVVTVLFIIGMVLLVGPTLLSGLLVGCSSIVPVSLGTTVYLAIALIVNMLLTVLYENMVQRCRRTRDSEKTEKNREIKRAIEKLLRVVQIASLLSILLIALHNPLSTANSNWKQFTTAHSATFAMMRYIGTVVVAATAGFFIGKWHNGKKEKSDSESEEIQENEDGSEETVTELS